jgi:hypothetical protein
MSPVTINCFCIQEDQQIVRVELWSDWNIFAIKLRIESYLQVNRGRYDWHPEPDYMQKGFMVQAEGTIRV